MTDNDIRNYKYMISNGIKEDKYDLSIEVKFNLVGENNMIIVIYFFCLFRDEDIIA